MNDGDVSRVVDFFKGHKAESFSLRDVQKALRIDKMKVSGIVETLAYFKVLGVEAFHGRIVYRYRVQKK